MKTPIPGISMHSDFQQYFFATTTYTSTPYSTTSPVMTSTSETTYDNLTAQISPSLSLSLVSTFTVVGIASYNLETIELNVNPGQSYNLKLSLTWCVCCFDCDHLHDDSVWLLVPVSDLCEFRLGKRQHQLHGARVWVCSEVRLRDLNHCSSRIKCSNNSCVPDCCDSERLREFKTDPSETAQTAASEKSETADIQLIRLTKSKILPIYSFRSWIAISSTTTSSIASVSSTETTTAQISSLTSIGIGAWIVLILSSINLSSIAVVWTIFSQFRLLIFLILTDAYLPQSVIDYITGMKFFSFNFSFLSFQTISVVKKPLQLIEFDQKQQHAGVYRTKLRQHACQTASIWLQQYWWCLHLHAA